MEMSAVKVRYVQQNTVAAPGGCASHLSGVPVCVGPSGACRGCRARLSFHIAGIPELAFGRMLFFRHAASC
jgi:hypothetical protein